MLLLVGPSGTDTFIVTVITVVVKPICNVVLHNLTTVIFRGFFYLSKSADVRVCVLGLLKICWSLQTWMFASCIHGNVLWKHNSCSAWHEIPGVWRGMLSHQRPPHHHAPLSDEALIQMEIETRLKGCWDDFEARHWQQADLKTTDCVHMFGKRTCLMITWWLPFDGCLSSIYVNRMKVVVVNVKRTEAIVR